MKPFFTTFKCLGVLALLALAAGCASTQNKEDMLVAAGFKVITPSTPEQTVKLKTLANHKVSQVQKNGKTYYVFPDAAHNQAYVGNPSQYQAYQQIRLERQEAKENLEAAIMNKDAVEMNQESEMNWGGWNGWDGTE
jgi:hypothetical protein